MAETTGTLTKLSITVCDVGGNGQASPRSSDRDTFEVMLNPSEFTHTQAISYNAPAASDGGQTGASGRQAIGKAAPTPEFTSYAADTVGLNLVIDGTGAVPTAGSRRTGGDEVSDVASEVAALQKIVYEYDKDEHRPNIVQILWGSFKMNCRLTSLSVNYTLFKPSGEPLRAKVSMQFVQFISRQEESKRADRKSSDLTKMVDVNAGTTLPLLCHEVYKDSSYYPEVARANDLDGFRGIKAGTKLIFPPLS